MASKRGSRGGDAPFPEPDMLPFMNLIFMLILAMISMSALLPLGTLSSEAQKLSSGMGGAAPEDDKKPLNLTLFVTDKGFNLSIRGVVKMGDKADPSNPNKKLPLIPMIANKDGEAEYDYAALRSELEKIKADNQEENRLVITADQEVIFDVIIQCMDASRLDSNKKPLFPSVSFAAGIVG